MEYQQPPRLVWIYSDSLAHRLDAATWLETTAELRKLGWRVTLIHKGDGRVHSVRGVDALALSAPNFPVLNNVLFHQQVVRYIQKHWDEIDIILFHQMSAHWVLPLKVKRAVYRNERPKLIMDTRTVPMLKTSVRDRLRAAFTNGIRFAVNYWADGQTAITTRMADHVSITKEDLLGIWPSGVNTEQFAAARNRQWPIGDEPIRLIYVGALYQERNIMGMCRAVEAANAAGLKFEFTIVGDGLERDALRNYATHTDGRIQVLPSVDHAEIPGLLSKSHIGVLPFPDRLMFQVSSPIKLFEYMAAGMPILATRISCHTDVIGNTPIVFWAESDSDKGLYASLIRCWNGRSQLSSMGERSAVMSEDWSWAEAARKLNNALLRLESL